MAEKKTSLFREKNIEAIQSPEVLNDYLRVTSPKIWIVLIAVIVLLIGTLLWGIFGGIDTSVSVAVVSEGQQCYIVAPYDALDGILACNTVQVGDTVLTLSGNISEPVSVTNDTDVRVRLAGDLAVGDIVSSAELNEQLPPGVFSGVALTEHIQPISLLLH